MLPLRPPIASPLQTGTLWTMPQEVSERSPASGLLTACSACSARCDVRLPQAGKYYKRPGKWIFDDFYFGSMVSSFRG